MKRELLKLSPQLGEMKNELVALLNKEDPFSELVRRVFCFFCSVAIEKGQRGIKEKCRKRNRILESTSHFELIADAAHRQNVLRLRGQRFEFFAQPADMNVQRAFVAVEIFAPDAF